jgi:phosphoglucosamine mutase
MPSKKNKPVRKLFGTDGIRGQSNQFPMTPDIVLKVAMAAASQFRRGEHRHRVVIAKDTRLSGYMLEPALVAGFVSMGMDVVMVGPQPTPAAAMLTRSLRADLGVMISASHNPYEDNGIKLFGPDGYKLSDEIEAAIEDTMSRSFDDMLAAPVDMGRATRLEDASGRYIEYAKNTLPKGQSFEGLKVVVDCANGAAYKAAPKILWELGAEVISTGVTPNGRNINHECGALYPHNLAKIVVEQGADIGIALDGDADRLVLVDEKGTVIDGDQVMGLLTIAWAEQGLLKGNGLVATVMTNLGLERLLTSKGLNLVRTMVGDRYVVERMRADGFNIGGEQSGHIVLSDIGTTGDGLVAALQVLLLLKSRQQKASEMLKVFKPLPQILKNIVFHAADYAGGDPLIDPRIQAVIDQQSALFGDQGRLLVRKSGTEAKIRVMAEGDDLKRVEQSVQIVIDAIAQMATSSLSCAAE